jgi:DNA-binding transcriptional ArsR family regulator
MRAGFNEAVEAAIRAIAERHRREIVRLVRDEELTAGQIAAHFEVSRPAVSQHLRILKDTGLVTERRQGTRRYYRARMEGLAELRAFLEIFLGEETWVSERPPAPGVRGVPQEAVEVDVTEPAGVRPQAPVAGG